MLCELDSHLEDTNDEELYDFISRACYYFL